MEKSRLTIIVFVAMILFSLLSTADADEKKTEIILAGIDNFKPYSYLDKNGDQQGIYIDIVEQLFANSKYSYKINVMPFRRSINMVMENHCHGIIGVYSTPERRKKLHYIDSTYLTKFQTTVFVAKNSPIKSSAIEEFTGKNIGKKRGFLNSPAYDQALKNGSFTVAEVETLEQLVLMLMHGRTDAFIFTDTQAIPYLRSTPYGNQIRMLEPPIRTGITYLAFSHVLLEELPTDFIPEMKKKMRLLWDSGVIEEIHLKHGVELQ